MASLIVETPPAAEPVSLATFKLHRKITIADEDALLTLYLQAAREAVENASGWSLVNKGYCQRLDFFPRVYPEHNARRWDERQMIKLLRAPLVKVSKLSFIGLDHASHDMLPAPELWASKTQYVAGNQVADPNGNLEEVTAAAGASLSGSETPDWGVNPEDTTDDGDLTWTNQGPAPAGDFQVDRHSQPPRLFPNFLQYWPLTLHVPDAVAIHFLAGCGNDAATAPTTLKVAVLQISAVWDEHREAVTPEDLKQVPEQFERLIWSERIMDYDPTRG